MTPLWLDQYLLPGRRLIDVGDGVLSAISPAREIADESTFDRHALIYDRLVGNAVYNRLVWGTSKRSYAAFSATAVAAASGPLLDVGCGTAVFTASSYRLTDRPLVLVDSSVAMLTRAAKRLSTTVSKQVAFIQADLFDLPFQPNRFDTVSCFGLLHLFSEPESVLNSLQTQLAFGGSLFATSLVAEERIGTRMLGLLHRSGEAAAPRSQTDVSIMARHALGKEADLWREGCTSFMRISLP